MGLPDDFLAMVFSFVARDDVVDLFEIVEVNRLYREIARLPAVLRHASVSELPPPHLQTSESDTSMLFD